MKRGLILSDLHSGHLVGLTPTAHQIKGKEGTTRGKLRGVQKEMWRRYTRMVKEFGPYDWALVNGDAIDGKGGKSGGSEQITTDPDGQADIAADALNHVRLHGNKGFKMYGTYGTGYHTGLCMDWENMVAERAGFESIAADQWLDVNGCTIWGKHHSGSSSVPYGRSTPTAKEHVWNVLKHDRDEQPRADLILRGHAHFNTYCGGPGWCAVALPALQAAGSKYGRRCTGIVDWGVTVVDVDKNGGFDFHCETVQIETQRAEVQRV